MRIARNVLTGIIFLFLTVDGLSIAIHKPLWTDEEYSLVHSTIDISYDKILTGGVNEGNNSPLFYILQKLQCDLFAYHPPQEWMQDQWGGVHLFDQFFLRVQPVLVGALSLCVLFYYFSRRYTLAIGFFAAIITMTSSMFVLHWTEARPYSLWMALGFIQSILLINVLEDSKKQDKKNMIFLILVHWLLALTSMISSVQIVAVGAALWIYKRPRLSLYVPLVLFPLGICVYYYAVAPHYQFFFIDGPVALISANIRMFRLLITLLAALILFLRCRSESWAEKIEIKYLIFLFLMLFLFFLVLLKMKFSQQQAQVGFQVSNRYFIPLVPVGIISTILYSVYLMRIFRPKIWAILVAVGMLFAGILVFHS